MLHRHDFRRPEESKQQYISDRIWYPYNHRYTVCTKNLFNNYFEGTYHITLFIQNRCQMSQMASRYDVYICSRVPCQNPPPWYGLPWEGPGGF